MIDLIKKAMLAGVGAASLTKDKVEELANDFVEKGKLSEQEGKKLVDDLISRTQSSRDDIKSQIEKRVQEVLAGMNLASKDDINELRQQIEDLKKTNDSE